MKLTVGTGSDAARAEEAALMARVAAGDSGEPMVALLSGAGEMAGLAQVEWQSGRLGGSRGDRAASGSLCATEFELARSAPSEAQRTVASSWP
jgi:hypothetical protein